MFQNFLGEQLDQLMCETLEATECGQKELYAFILTTVIILPIALFKRLRALAMANIVILTLTFFSMLTVTVYSLKIMSQTAE